MKKENLKKTIQWSEVGLFFKNVGAGKAKHSENFVDYIFNTPSPAGKLYDFLDKMANTYAKGERSEYVFEKEDDCLFDASMSSAIDIILRNLKEIDMGKDVKALWCYLDSEKKAVVHFINKKGWYAEAYFEVEQENSYLHLVEDEAGHKAFIPVLFTPNLSKYKDKVAVTGGVILQDYLPRHKFGILGKNTAAHNGKFDEKSSNKRSKHQRKKDNRDSL